ncbi:MAG: outer membrane beta-barrel protein [Gemmatimonadetes bacterium]|nr:outer membrane beta-barrel protein [Gemmatimonadota bacterium]
MRCCLTFGTFLLFAFPAGLLGQSFPGHDFFFEITPQVGFLAPEEPEGAEIEARPLFGGRVGYRRATGFGFEAQGAFTSLELEVSGQTPEIFDLTTFVYGVDGLYTWSVSPRTDVSLALGVGGVTWSPDRDGADDLSGDPDSETNLQVALGLAARALLTPSIALRGDIRDHVVFDQLADTARDLELVDRGQTNNLEVSVGASFVLP